MFALDSSMASESEMSPSVLNEIAALGDLPVSDAITAVEKLRQQRIALKRENQFYNRAHGNISWTPPPRESNPELYEKWQVYVSESHRLGANISSGIASICETLPAALLARLQERYGFAELNDGLKCPLETSSSNVKPEQNFSLINQLAALGDPKIVGLVFKVAAFQKEIRHIQSQLESNDVNIKHSVDVQLQFIARQHAWPRVRRYSLNRAANTLGKRETSIHQCISQLRQQLPAELRDRVLQSIHTPNYHSGSNLSVCPECALSDDDFDPKPSPWYNCSTTDEVSCREKLSNFLVQSLLEDLKALENPSVLNLLDKATKLQHRVHTYEYNLECKKVNSRLPLNAVLEFIEGNQWGKHKKIRLKKSAEDIEKCEATITDECIVPLAKMLPAALFACLRRFMIATNHNKDAFNTLKQWLKDNAAGGSEDSESSPQKATALNEQAVLKLVDKAKDLQKLIVPWKRYLEFGGWYQPLSNLPTSKMKQQFVSQQVAQKPWILPRREKLERAVVEIHMYQSRIARECIVPLSQMLSPELFARLLVDNEALRLDDGKWENCSGVRTPLCEGYERAGHFGPDPMPWRRYRTGNDSKIPPSHSETCNKSSSLPNAVLFCNPKIFGLIDRANELQRRITAVMNQLAFEGWHSTFCNMPTFKIRHQFLLSQLMHKEWSLELKKQFKTAIWRLSKWESRIGDECLIPLGKLISPELFDRVGESMYALNRRNGKWEDYLDLSAPACPKSNPSPGNLDPKPTPRLNCATRVSPFPTRNREIPKDINLAEVALYQLCLQSKENERLSNAPAADSIAGNNSAKLAVNEGSVDTQNPVKHNNGAAEPDLTSAVVREFEPSAPSRKRQFCPATVSQEQSSPVISPSSIRDYAKNQQQSDVQFRAPHQPSPDDNYCSSGVPSQKRYVDYGQSSADLQQQRKQRVGAEHSGLNFEVALGSGNRYPEEPGPPKRLLYDCSTDDSSMRHESNSPGGYLGPRPPLRLGNRMTNLHGVPRHSYQQRTETNYYNSERPLRTASDIRPVFSSDNQTFWRRHQHVIADGHSVSGMRHTGSSELEMRSQQGLDRFNKFNPTIPFERRSNVDAGSYVPPLSAILSKKW